MDYTTEVNGSEYTFSIDYRMNWIDDLRGGVVWGVEDWSVSHVDGRRNRLGDFWKEQMSPADDEAICNAIMEWESE